VLDNWNVIEAEEHTVNRRELFGALAGLPFVKTVEIARLQADDVVVIESDDYISEQGRQNIKAACAQVFGPDRKVVVMDRGLRLKVVKDA